MNQDQSESTPTAPSSPFTTSDYWYPEIEDLCAEIARNNIAHGFKAEGERRDPVHVAMLILSEVVEAFEELRSGRGVDEIYFICPVDKKEYPPNLVVLLQEQQFLALCPEHRAPLKPEGFPIEMADALIRILDAAPEYGWGLSELVAHKMAYNVTRPYKHGKTM